jgi:antirestriction protein ArdC
MRPVNIASKKAYRGINILALWAAADEKGFSSGVWGYKHWAEAGAQVRKGDARRKDVSIVNISIPKINGSN